MAWLLTRSERSGKRWSYSQGPNRGRTEYEPGEGGKASTLAQALDDVLKEMEIDTDLFQHLLCSYPARLAEVNKQHD